MLVVVVRRRTAVRWAGVLVAAGGLTGCGSASSAPIAGPPPTHHTILRPVVDTSGAGRIVGDPHARLGSLSTIPGHPGRRIAEWYLCRDHACYHRTYALVVSGDGFRTSHLVELAPSRVANGWYVEPAGPDHFAVSPNGGRRTLVSLTGDVTRVHVAGSTGPLVGHEVPLRSSKAGFVAVDPATGDAHPLSTPAGVVELAVTPSGQLRALTFDHPRYFWSADGGATWHEIPIPRRYADLDAGFVTTTSDSLHALVLGGENTVFPWDHVLRSTNGRRWTSYIGPTDPTGYIDDSVVLPDDRLLLNVDGWSDQRGSHPSVNPTGLWAGTDWTHLRPVPPTWPFAGQDVHGFVPTILDIAATRRTITLYALAPGDSGAVSSTDGGGHWSRVRAR
jgi:hypothetical protein